MCNLALGLLTARLLDTLPVNIKYVIVFGLGGLVGMADMICFGFCEETYTTNAERLHFREIMGEIVRNRSFLRFAVMWTAWCFTANLCDPRSEEHTV